MTTPLHSAVINHQIDAIKLLLELGADTDIRDMDWESAPIHWTMQYDDHEVVKILLSYGACVDVTDGGGYSPRRWGGQNLLKSTYSQYELLFV